MGSRGYGAMLHPLSWRDARGNNSRKQITRKRQKAKLAGASLATPPPGHQGPKSLEQAAAEGLLKYVLPKPKDPRPSQWPPEPEVPREPKLPRPPKLPKPPREPKPPKPPRIVAIKVPKAPKEPKPPKEVRPTGPFPLTDAENRLFLLLNSYPKVAEALGNQQTFSIDQWEKERGRVVRGIIELRKNGFIIAKPEYEKLTSFIRTWAKICGFG